MKSFNFKKIILSLLLIPIIMVSIIGLGACKGKNSNEEPDLQIDGVNVVLSLDEVDELLAQASVQPAPQSSPALVPQVSAKAKKEYTKADLLIIINQIKQNIENSTYISGDISYTMDGVEGVETCVVTREESYFYANQGGYESESWYKNEDGTLYYYEINDEEYETVYKKMLAEPFMNNNGVYDFCQGKFTFTCVTLTEDDIESYKINKNKMYIKLNATIFNDGEVEVTESFVVKKGRIITDHVTWEGVDLVANYTYDDKVDLSPLQLPEGIVWEEN